MRTQVEPIFALSCAVDLEFTFHTCHRTANRGSRQGYGPKTFAAELWEALKYVFPAPCRNWTLNIFEPFFCPNSLVSLDIFGFGDSVNA